MSARRGAGEAAVDPVLQSLLDEREVVAVCTRYATAIDDGDWTRFRACFLPDARVSYRPGQWADGVAAVEQAVRDALRPLTRTQHAVSTFVVEVHGDEASCRCYLRAQHVREGLAGGETFTVGGRYVDLLARTADGWRIRERRVDRWWTEGNPAVMAR